jgi:hypothetical protein
VFFVTAVLIFILVPGACALALAQAKVRHTTLKPVWCWWAISGLVLAAAVLVSALKESAGIADQLWYLAAVLLLCPLIAALGARRPGDVAWAFFVIIPLVLVLEWPAVSMMMTSDIHEPLVLQTPAVIGVFLVLLMGAGNYLGTRFTLAVILLSAAVTCFVLSVCELRPERLAAVQLRYVGCIPLVLAICSAIASLLRWNTSEVGIRRVWSDFRDSFGIVWSRRVAERFNLMATREKLDMRMRHDGPAVENATAEVRMLDSAETSCRGDAILACSRREEQILRWILKRFVDDEWLNTRFGSHENIEPTPDL